MGRIIRCPECGEVYRELEAVEELRDNDGICVVCNAPIEVADWDRVLSSYDDDDLDDVDALDDDDDDDGWAADVEIDDDDVEFDDSDDVGDSEDADAEDDAFEDDDEDEPRD